MQTLGTALLDSALLGGGSFVGESGSAIPTGPKTLTLLGCYSLGTTTLDVTPSPPSVAIVLPPDLAAAIKALFVATPSLTSLATGGIFNGVTVGKPDPPYIVFSIESGSTIDYTDVSIFYNAKVRFDCYATRMEDAEGLKQATRAAYVDQVFDWVGGWSIPAVPLDRAQKPEKNRAPGDNRLNRASILFSMRCHEDR